MPYIFSYTRQGEERYVNTRNPNQFGWMCDLDHAMHLAISCDGTQFTPLRNNTGILFPRCTFNEGNVRGTTKTLLYPWIFRMQDQSFGVVAVRRNQNAPDPLSVGCAMLFTSKDLVRYEEARFLKLADGEITNPRCRWDADENAYYLEWLADGQRHCGYTRYFNEVCRVSVCEASRFDDCGDFGIDGAVPGNVIEITDDEAAFIRAHFDVIYNVGVAPMAITVEAGAAPAELPKAVCLYSDGSTHEKLVKWDEAALAAIDFSVPGEYTLPGEIQMKHWPFPMQLGQPKNAPSFMRNMMSDPCVLHYNGKYYLTSSSGGSIMMRVGDTLEGVFAAEPFSICEVPPVSEGARMGTWASELHIINGVPYLLTGVCAGPWTTVKSCILRCNGDPGNPADWEAPRECRRADGTILTPGGISLDMTYFCVNGVHYAMWSDRIIHFTADGAELPEPANVLIATIDPDEPWNLTSEPVCILQPVYGWDRCETEVDEGPYLLRRGDDLFITISGSSTGLADLYTVGLLHAKCGANLLSPEGWDWLPYPLLTKESVENQYGPGHNCFVKDPDTGDDLIVYHAVPHDADGKSLGRQPGVRRVHFAKTGYPYLEMTEERDLDPQFKNVTLQITVK